MEYLIGLDIGTQGAKALMIDGNGKPAGSSYSGYDVLHPKPLWAEQWPEVWVDGIVKTLRSLLESTQVDAGRVALREVPVGEHGPVLLCHGQGF